MTDQPAAETVLAALRAHKEFGSTFTKPDGSTWADVYLDNARPKGMSAHSFAGALGVLAQRGLYKETDFAWGRVKLADASAEGSAAP